MKKFFGSRNLKKQPVFNNGSRKGPPGWLDHGSLQPTSPHRLGRSVVHATSTSTGAMAVGKSQGFGAVFFFTKRSSVGVEVMYHISIVCIDIVCILGTQLTSIF